MADTDDFLDCLDCRCADARREAARLTRLYDEKLRPHGISINQFTTLTTLILGGPQTISVLAERLGIDRTTLSRNISICIGRGMLAASPGEDARERVVSATAAGMALARAALPAWRAAQVEAVAVAG